jgi:hypothetical protein
MFQSLFRDNSFPKTVSAPTLNWYNESKRTVPHAETELPTRKNCRIEMALVSVT